MFKFLSTSEFRWIDLKEFDLNRYTKILQNDVFLKLILNILQSYENYLMITL